MESGPSSTMVLQDIKNKPDSGSETHIVSRKRVKSRKRRPRKEKVNISGSSQNETCVHDGNSNLDLPLLERIQMALSKRKESSHSSVSAEDKELHDPENTASKGDSGPGSSPRESPMDKDSLDAGSPGTGNNTFQVKLSKEHSHDVSLSSNSDTNKSKEEISDTMDSSSKSSTDVYDPDCTLSRRLSIGINPMEMPDYPEAPSPDDSYQPDLVSGLDEAFIRTSDVAETSSLSSFFKGNATPIDTEKETQQSSEVEEKMDSEHFGSFMAIDTEPKEVSTVATVTSDQVPSPTPTSSNIMQHEGIGQGVVDGEITSERSSDCSADNLRQEQGAGEIVLAKDILSFIDIPFDEPTKKVTRRRSNIMSVVTEASGVAGASYGEVNEPCDTLDIAPSVVTGETLDVETPAPICIINDKRRRGRRPKKRKQNTRVSAKKDFPTSLSSEPVAPDKLDSEGTSSSSFDTTSTSLPETPPTLSPHDFSDNSDNTVNQHSPSPEKLTRIQESETQSSDMICIINDDRKKRRGRKKKSTPCSEVNQSVSDSVPDILDSIDIPLIDAQQSTGPKPSADQLSIKDLDLGTMFDAPSRPRQRKRRRRSADTDLCQSLIISSPDIDPDSLPIAEPPSSNRRSRRLRRKSLDIYRSSVMKKNEDWEYDGSQNLVSEADQVETPAANLVSAGSAWTHIVEEGMIKYTDENKGLIPASEDAPVLNHLASPTAENQEEVCRPRRTSKPSAPTDSDASFDISEPRPKRARQNKKNEPAVEDIYRNKLWKEQMPKQKVWETIFEAPKVKKFGCEELMSNKRFKRQVNFDDFYSTARLKRRRKKALQSGWKPLTDKQDKLAEGILKKKLEAFEEMLDSTDCASYAEAPSTISLRQADESEDKYFTPVKSASDLRYATFEDSSSDRSAELSSANVSLSPSPQIYETPSSDLHARSTALHLDKTTPTSSKALGGASDL